MMTFEKALQQVLTHTSVGKMERALVEESLGAVLAKDVYSRMAMPPFDKSAVDGFALRAVDIKKIPAVLKVVGKISAGERFARGINRGECVKIMTGAPLPPQADSVVMVEDTKLDGDKVLVLKSLEKGTHRCRKGEELKPGGRVLSKGTVIAAAHVAILAAVGQKFVEVIARPKVCVLNTGGEIVPAGCKRPPFGIYNSNGPMLTALLKSDGINAHYLGIVRDSRSELMRAIKKGLAADMLLISGGVSMGDADLVPEALEALGVKKIFHKVKIKPGKPCFFGINAGKKKGLVFGVPGNPVSGFVAYALFIRPALRKMAGYKNFLLRFQKATLQEPFRRRTGYRQFVPVRISQGRGQQLAFSVDSRSSADIFSLAGAQGLMAVQEGTRGLRKGAQIEFLPLETTEKPGAWQ